MNSARSFEQPNIDILSANQDRNDHYPQIVDLHTAFPPLIKLFTRNEMLLIVSDALFGCCTAL